MSSKKLPIVAIVGRANVGKSSLFNAVLERREAIVAREAGTTRDSIMAKADYRGQNFWLVDTAGIKEAEDDFEFTIQEQIQQLDLSNEDKGFLLDLMAKPADAAAIARLAKTKEQAAELYVASRVAIGEADTPEEKAYLERLVALLDLPQDLVAHLDSQISSVRTTVAAS